MFRRVAYFGPVPSGCTRPRAAQAAVKALPDGRGWLRWPTVAFPSHRPCVGLGAVRLTDGFRGTQAGMFGSHLRAAELPRMTSREVLMAVY